MGVEVFPTCSIPASHLGSFKEDDRVGQRHRRSNRRTGKTFVVIEVRFVHRVGESLEPVVQQLEQRGGEEIGALELLGLVWTPGNETFHCLPV